MGTRNAVGGTRQADLSGLYKAAAGLTGIGGLGLALNQMGQNETQDAGPTAEESIAAMRDMVQRALGPDSPIDRKSVV